MKTRKYNDALPEGLKLLKAYYIKDYIYCFEFNNGEVLGVNFKPILKGPFAEYLDKKKFKKMRYLPDGDICWEPNISMSMPLQSYYGHKSVRFITEDEITKLLKKEGNEKISRGIFRNMILGRNGRI